MPYSAKKHEDQETIEIVDFLGGMNRGMPAALLKDNEMARIDNMFFDRRSGRPRTRYPITKYSNSAPTGNVGPVQQ